MVKANFCLNCLTFGCYEEEIHIHEYSPFKGREFVDKIEGNVYCLKCEDGGQIVFGEVDEEVFEKIKELYSTFVLLLAIADNFSAHPRATIKPSRIIPEGLNKELAEKAIREESHEAIVEAWIEVLREKIAKKSPNCPNNSKSD